MSDYVTKTNVLSALARFKENTDALYETKADANEMKSEINQHESRLENLEQKAGDYSIVQYRGTNAVPTGKAKYGLVKSIVGKIRVWNQLANPANNNSSIVGAGEIDGITVTYNPNTGYYHVSGTASANYDKAIIYNLKFNEGHKYIIFSSNFPVGSSQNTSIYIYGSVPFEGGLWNGNVGASRGSGLGAIYITVSNGTSVDFDFKVVIRDLTLILNDWQNSDITTANIPLMVQQIPDLLKYNAYDAGSLVDTEVSGVKSVGVNLCDEDFEVGDLSVSDGSEIPSSTYIRSANFCKIQPNTRYYLISGSSNKNYVFFYDYNENFISFYRAGGFNNDYFDTPVNAHYFRITTNQISYKHDIQLCLNSYADKTTYHPYKTDTIMLSAPVTLKSAGSVAEVLTFETGKKTRPVRSYTFTGNEIWEHYTSWGSTTTWKITLDNLPNDLKDAVHGWDGQLVCPKYLLGTTEEVLGGSKDMTTILHGGSGFYICDSSITNASECQSATAGMKIVFQLNTPDPDEQVCDPIIDNTILTEGGGTIETIQTQTPVIDNSLDVGYLAV